ncbi:MAG: WecB/TagA/CpsF family glycosyltransferase [Thermosynechococcaceae cyanobacterium]
MSQAINTKELSRIVPTLPTLSIIGSPVTAKPFKEQMRAIMMWAKERRSKAVCVANTHMLIEAYRNPDFGSVLQNADMVTPDGRPLVWMMKTMGALQQDRVAGMDIFTALCQAAPREKVSIFLLGSQSDILGRMQARLKTEFPDLDIAGVEPLPFRPMTPAEDSALIERVNASGAGIVFLALGCPKQEAWIDCHRDKIQSVMIGLGGVFPVYAGIQKRAPGWIRSSGLEWLYRLMQEPTRLWKRYSSTIPPFVWLALQQVLEQKFASGCDEVRVARNEAQLHLEGCEWFDS